MSINFSSRNENSYRDDLAGAALGIGAVGLAGGALSLLAKSTMKKLLNDAPKLTDQEIESVKISANKILATTGLKDKGVKINWITDRELKEIKDQAKNLNFSKKKLDLLKKSKEGGGFAFLKNTINIRGKNFILSAFHEIGHAMNKNFGTLSKITHMSFALCLLSIPIALYALFKPSKLSTTNKKDKQKDFIKDNVGELTFATFIPLLIEEARASIRGLQEAKKVLSPAFYKLTVKGYKWAFLSYLATATFASLGTYIACKIKDTYINRNK